MKPHTRNIKNVYILIATEGLLWLVQFVKYHKFKIYVHFILNFKIMYLNVFFLLGDSSLSELYVPLAHTIQMLGNHPKERIQGGGGKSLARPRRKQATMTKLGIYSTYSPRSSRHFLAHCSNFCKPLKKNSEGCPSNLVSVAAMTSPSDEKWRPFNCFFSPGNRW